MFIIKIQTFKGTEFYGVSTIGWFSTKRNAIAYLKSFTKFAPYHEKLPGFKPRKLPTCWYFKDGDVSRHAFIVKKGEEVRNER